MKKTLFLAITLMILFVNMVSAAEIHVFPGDSIQGAVNNSSVGDIIIVHTGQYAENVYIDRSVSIVSETGDPDKTIVKAEDPDTPAFTVSGDAIAIKGFLVTGVSGINVHGIYLLSCNNSTISNNRISYIESGDGIHLTNSSNNLLDNNTLAWNGMDGIRVFNSENNIVINNVAKNNGWNGFNLELATNTVFSNNSASGNNMAGISSYMSANDTLVNNELHENGAGIYLYNLTGTSVNSNNISDNECGIYLHVCYGIEAISSNDLFNNTYGLSLIASSNSTINTNNVSENIIGIYLDSSSNNNLVYNNYFSNKNNVQIDGNQTGNIWNTNKKLGVNILGGPYTGGNYWTQAGGNDTLQGPADFDGIANSPYRINGDNADYFPLTESNSRFHVIFTAIMVGLMAIIVLLVARFIYKRPLS